MEKIYTGQYQQPSINEFTFALFVEDDIALYSLILGNIDTVREVVRTLQRILDLGQADEFINHLDERLGYKWLSVSEAAKEYDVPRDTVRYAARNGQIRMAERDGKPWRFPAWAFRQWLTDDYRPRKDV